MAFAQKLQRLDGRHKLAIIAAIVAWGVSMFFSKEGFSLDSPRASWLGWVLAFIGTVVELVFNTKTRKLSLTLIIVGVLYYMYGIWTNVTGFWDYQHAGVVFQPIAWRSVLPWFVGAILEVLPEPFFMWGIGSELEGDLIGNLVGLWSGNLGYAEPEGSTKNNYNAQPKQEQRREPSFHMTGQPPKGKGRGFYESQRSGKPASSPSDTQPKINRFTGFGE